jgi:DnaJ-class molecular chaperone
VSETTETEPSAPLPCSPCRGTGTLLSNKGGEPHTVTCPWCEGGGVELPEHDAQAARRAGPGETA